MPYVNAITHLTKELGAEKEKSHADLTRLTKELGAEKEKSHADLTRLTKELGAEKEKSNADLTRLTKELGAEKEKSHADLTILTKDLSDTKHQFYTASLRSNEAMAQLVSGRDTEMKAMRGEIDTLNKTVLRISLDHKLEIEHLHRFHHRRLLEAGAQPAEAVVAGEQLNDLWF